MVKKKKRQEHADPVKKPPKESCMEKALKRIQSFYFTVLFRFRRIFSREAEFTRRIWHQRTKITKIHAGWLFVLLLSLLIHLVLLIFFLSSSEPRKMLKKRKTKTFHIKILKPKAAPKPKTPEKQEITSEVTAQETNSDPAPENQKPDKKPDPSIFGIGKDRNASGETTGTGGAEAGGGREAKLARYGGSKKTENAVKLGLEWLVAHQDKNGSWDTDDFSKHCPENNRCHHTGHPQYDAGVTALALTALLAQGTSIPQSWKAAIENAKHFLMAKQQKNGNFGPETASFMYNQAIATYALAEYYNSRKDPVVASAVTASLRFINNAQQPGGGWDYTSEKNNRNDLSITAWQILSINKCRDAGLAIPETGTMLQKAVSCITKLVDPDQGTATYADRGIGSGKNRPGLIPAALVGLILAGGGKNGTSAKKLADILLNALPDSQSIFNWNYTGQSFYYWYYGSLALFYMDNKTHWRIWNTQLKKVLLELQKKQGHEKGSWSPEPNLIGNAGGRVYSTAIAILMLEIYYRIEK